MNATPEARERLEELLAERAVSGLEPHEEAELRALLAVFPDVDADQFERVVAELDVAFAQSGSESLSAETRRALAGHAARARRELGRAPAPRRRGFGTRAMQMAPWLVSAAAVALWIAVPRAPTELELAAQRSELVAKAGDVVTVQWAATQDPSAAAGVSGDVCWSAGEQRGFVRLRGLAANDATREQYQLWIFDGTRDERFPVDGGVFDVRDPKGETIIPIKARIAVGKPVLFAVTVEKPGGVVVSGRERIALTAKTDL
jgi:hypothetical protein